MSPLSCASRKCPLEDEIVLNINETIEYLIDFWEKHRKDKEK